MSKCKKTPYDFTLFQGDDHSFYVLYKNGQGVAKDLTGYTAAMQAREDYETDGTVLELDETDGLTITAAQGKVAVAISNEKSGAIPPGIYVYDLKITSPAGIVKTLAFGKMTILAEVTK